MMLARIIQFLIGASFGASGAYLVWTRRTEMSQLFPPGPEGLPLMLIAGVGALSLAVVFLVSAAAPRPKRTARLQAAAARRAETLRAADVYYAERSRAADRDWRSGKLPPHTPPAPSTHSPDPLLDQPVRADPAPDSLFEPEPPLEPEPPRFEPEPKTDPLFDPAAYDAAPAATPPEPAPPPPSPDPSALRQGAAKPVASSVPPTPMVFSSNATLSPIPKSSDPPPMVPPSVAGPTERPSTTTVAATASLPAPGAANEQAADPAFADIRVAIREGRLEDADRLLNASRETATGLALAELTGLAGDHAAAAGRESNAKWLWRLALKRFGEAGALDSPAARQVSERLRLAGQ